MTLAIALLSVLLAANLLRFRDALYPPVLHTLLWLGVLVAYVAMSSRFVEIPPLALLVVVAGAIAFSVGSYATSFSLRHSARAPANEATLPAAWMVDAYLVLVTIGLAAFYLRARSIGAEGPTTNFFVNLRLAISGNPEVGIAPASYGVVQYLLPLSVVTLGLTHLLNSVRPRPWRMRLAVVVALSYAIFATGRTFILSLLVLLVVLSVCSGRTGSAKAAGLFLLAGLLAFVGVALVLGKAGDGSGEAMFQEIASYSLGGVVAFGRRMTHGESLAWGANSFRTVLATLAALRLPVRVPDLIQPYEFIPTPTNVYTFYQPYFADFGLPGTIVAAFAAGMLHGRAYLGTVRRDARWMLALGLLTYPLFMQFFEDQYLTLLSTWIQFACWSFLAFGAARFRRSYSASRVLAPAPGTQQV